MYLMRVMVVVCVIISDASTIVIGIVILVMVVVTCREVKIQINSQKSETLKRYNIMENSFQRHTQKSLKDSSENLTFFTGCAPSMTAKTTNRTHKLNCK